MHARVLAAVALLVTILPTAARADVAPPPGDCANKKEGEACKDESGRDGACGTITYTATNHATNPPTTSTRSYFGCRSGVAPTVTKSAKKCSVAFAGEPTSGAAFALAAAAVGLAALQRRRARRRG